MLAGRVGATLDGALVGKALFALQKQLFAFATALTALGIEITSTYQLLVRYGAFSADGSRCAEWG